MAQQFVENVLAVHKKYLDMIKEVFQGDQAFIGALDKACNAVINHRQPKQPSKAPELVSLIFKEFGAVHWLFYNFCMVTFILLPYYQFLAGSILRHFAKEVSERYIRIRD